MELNKILIVDDDREFCLDIQEYFEGDFICEYACSTIYATKILRDKVFDLVILDVEIGKESGIDYYSEVVKYHRGRIIFLSGINDVNLRLQSYEMGAEDFLIKPFDLTELLYKVKKVIDLGKFNQQYNIGDYKIDLEYQKIYYKGEPIKVQLMRFKLFVYFLNHQDIELSRERIFEDIWGYEEQYAARLVDVNVSKLRKEIPGIEIKNIWGIGYKFTLIK